MHSTTLSVCLSFGLFGWVFYKYVYPALIRMADQHRRSIQKKMINLKHQLIASQKQLEKVSETVDHFHDVRDEIIQNFQQIIEKRSLEQLDIFEKKVQKRLDLHQQIIEKEFQRNSNRIENLIRGQLKQKILGEVTEIPDFDVIRFFENLKK